MNPMLPDLRTRNTLCLALLASSSRSTTPKPKGETAMTATLQFPDGKAKTFVVRPDVDLTKANLGEEVVIRATEALAVVVEKP